MPSPVRVGSLPTDISPVQLGNYHNCRVSVSELSVQVYPKIWVAAPEAWDPITSKDLPSPVMEFQVIVEGEPISLKAKLDWARFARRSFPETLSPHPDTEEEDPYDFFRKLLQAAREDDGIQLPEGVFELLGEFYQAGGQVFVSLSYGVS